MQDEGLARAVDQLRVSLEKTTARLERLAPPEPLPPMPRRLQSTDGTGLWAMAAQFKTMVPAAYLTDDGVRCVCGVETVLEAPFVACSGGCGRWFQPTVGGARAAGPYPPADEAVDAAAAA